MAKRLRTHCTLPPQAPIHHVPLSFEQSSHCYQPKPPQRQLNDYSVRFNNYRIKGVYYCAGRLSHACLHENSREGPVKDPCAGTCRTQYSGTWTRSHAIQIARHGSFSPQIREFKNSRRSPPPYRDINATQPTPAVSGPQGPFRLKLEDPRKIQIRWFDRGEGRNLPKLRRIRLGGSCKLL